MRAMPSQSKVVMASLAPEATSATQPVQMPIWPQKPQVPMPELTGAPFICNLKMQVAMGPVMAEARMGGIQILGFLTMLGICSMLVPTPWATRPPQRFSLKLMTAKPIICAQQPATAAPPARPARPKPAQMAAEEMGSVRAMPMRTATRTPMIKGFSSVAHMMA